MAEASTICILQLLQGVGQIFADALAAYFFACGTEAAGGFGSGRLLGAPTPHCRNRYFDRPKLQIFIKCLY